MNFNYNEAKSLREQRAATHARALPILSQKTITAEDRARFDRIMSEVDGLSARIDAAEGKTGHLSGGDYKRSLAFGRYIRHGADILEASEKRMMETRDIAEGNQALHIGTYSGLGYFVPTGFQNAIEQATKYFCPMSDSSVSGCDVMSTDAGNALPFPTSNDTNQVATIVGEAASVPEQDLTAGQVVLTAYKLSSGIVKASIELLQDSAFNVEDWLAQRFGERYGRGLEGYFTTGTGQGQPTGILTAVEASGVSPVIATGSSSNDGVGAATNSIGSQDLVNLEHGVDPSYRRGARYMLNDNTLGLLQKLLDKFGRPLWTPGVAVNVPATINGYPYVINQSLSNATAAANPILFGDFSKFKIRKVSAIAVQRLNELFAQNGQVGFISFQRWDSNLVNASGSYPINLLEMHS